MNLLNTSIIALQVDVVQASGLKNSDITYESIWKYN